jgi:hypothetical protein
MKLNLLVSEVYNIHPSARVWGPAGPCCCLAVLAAAMIPMQSLTDMWTDDSDCNEGPADADALTQARGYNYLWVPISQQHLLIMLSHSLGLLGHAGPVWQAAQLRGIQAGSAGSG